ncbi:MAG: signal transduction histidine kinase, partial [Myxococcota bacterium]
AGTLQTILKLHPEAKRLLAVGDRTRSGHAAMDRVRRAALTVKGRVEMDYREDWSVAELKSHMTSVDRETVVLYVSFLRDRDGVGLSLEHSRTMLSAASSSPVYCFWDFFEGTGLTGGRGLSAVNQGGAVGRIARRIVGGEPVGGMPVQHLMPNPYLFDWEQLQRFGIGEDRLPDHRVIVNRTPDFYESNRRWILGITAFLLLESVLVAAYLIGRRKRRRLEERLRTAERLEAVGRLAAGVAHDFRNQLTVIRGFCDMALNEPTLPPDQRTRLEHMAGATRSAADLVAQLLSFARRQQLSPSVMLMDSLLEDLTSPIRHLLGEAVSLKVTVQPGSRLSIDRAQFERALLNLAANARDAMPVGGTLTLEAARFSANHPEAPPSNVGGWARLIVSDTGEGMVPEVRDRAFEPFFTTKSVGRGTGLGLSMVYGFVRQSGGTATVTSDLGVGTRVEIWLPETMDPCAVEAPAGPSHATGEITLRRATTPALILAVEDEPILLELLNEVLIHAGYEVISTYDPTLAEQLAVDNPGICLLITDVVMPGLYGPEVAERVLRHIPDIPVLYVSGHTRDALERVTGSDETPNLLTKPYTPADLTCRVAALLER